MWAMLVFHDAQWRPVAVILGDVPLILLGYEHIRSIRESDHQNRMEQALRKLRELWITRLDKKKSRAVKIY